MPRFNYRQAARANVAERQAMTRLNGNRPTSRYVPQAPTVADRRRQASNAARRRSNGGNGG